MDLLHIISFINAGVGLAAAGVIGHRVLRQPNHPKRMVRLAQGAIATYIACVYLLDAAGLIFAPIPILLRPAVPAILLLLAGDTIAEYIRK